ncbi:MAG: flavin reductase family protein [Chloroflexota bacterium]
MNKTITEGFENLYHYYPSVASIVTCHARGKDNGMAAAWNFPLSHTPPIFGVCVSAKRFSYELILEAGEFAVNFLPYSSIELIERMGANSGRDVDKFARFSVAVEKAVKIGAPLLKDAYAAYECRLLEHRLYGDHELVIGEVVAAHYDSEAFTAEGIIRPERVSPALYIGGDKYLTLDKGSLRWLERQKYKL